MAKSILHLGVLHCLFPSPCFPPKWALLTRKFSIVFPVIAASLNMINRCCCVWYIYIFDCCFAIPWARLVHLHGSSLMLRFHRMILSYQRQKSFLYHQNGRLSRGASRPFSAVSQPPSASPIAALLTITTYSNAALQPFVDFCSGRASYYAFVELSCLLKERNDLAVTKSGARHQTMRVGRR